MSDVIYLPSILRAMAKNYAGGHRWDHLDSEAVTKAADHITALEAERDRLKVIADNYYAMLADANAELARLRAGQEPTTGFDYSIKTYSTNTTTPQPSAVPDGWKLVPVEPTVGMLDIAVSHALAVSLSRDYSWSAYMRDVWMRMVEASLEPGK